MTYRVPIETIVHAHNEEIVPAYKNAYGCIVDGTLEVWMWYGPIHGYQLTAAWAPGIWFRFDTIWPEVE